MIPFAPAVPVLSVRDLTVDVAGPEGWLRVVDGISFELPTGGSLALVGESGSGKTMTAMAALGLGPLGTRMRTGGTTALEGRALLALPPAAQRRLRRGRVGCVFQDPAAALNPLMTVAAQIAEAARAAGRDATPASLRRRLAEVALDGVPDILRRYPHQLSGGQQQRAMIAMALAGDPVLLVADEPTSALDSTVQAQILDLIDRLRRARGMALLMIAHDMGVVARMADTIAVLRAGRIVEAGPAAELLARPSSSHARALLACTPRLDQRLERLTTIEMVERGERPRPAAPRGPGAAGGAAVLEVQGLTVRYPGRTPFSPAVTGAEDVSLRLARGQAHGLLGESGSGKSTVARALVGLGPRATGRIIVEGQALADPRRMHRALRQRIQYIFQDARGALNPRMTLRQTLSEPLEIHGLARGAARAAVIARLMDEVGLPAALLDRNPHELSGGQRQRLTIARALALEPGVLVCDEIVSALDVSVQAQVLNLLADLREARGLSILFISHNLAAVAHLCETVSVMAQGRVVESGPVDAILAAPAAEQTRALIAAAGAVAPPVPRQALAG